MSSEDLRSSLERLRASAAQMNSLTESISDAFRVVEHFLVTECNLGIGKWVPAGTVGATPLELGFRRAEGKWRLCIRPAEERGTKHNYLSNAIVANPSFQTVVSNALTLPTQ